MFVPHFPPRRLVARRRSRCWKCDKPLKRMGLSGHSWWCEKCEHIVTYWTPRET